VPTGNSGTAIFPTSLIKISLLILQIINKNVKNFLQNSCLDFSGKSIYILSHLSQPHKLELTLGLQQAYHKGHKVH
jgi:hypothetical protein